MAERTKSVELHGYRLVDASGRSPEASQWKAQDPLARRRVGDHRIDEMGSTCGHAPASAGGTEAAAFAAEGDETVGTASIASKSGEAVGEHTALEKAAELGLDEARHTSAIGIVVLGPSEKCLEVSADSLMQNGPFAVAARVGATAGG